MSKNAHLHRWSNWKQPPAQDGALESAAAHTPTGSGPRESVAKRAPSTTAVPKHVTGIVRHWTTATRLPTSRSHTRIVRSFDPDTTSGPPSRPPPSRTAKHITQSVWPRSSATHAPLLRSQTRTLCSRDPDTTRTRRRAHRRPVLPSTSPRRCGRSALNTHRSLLKSHTCMLR